MTFERHLEGTSRLAGPGAVIPEQWYQATAFSFSNPYATRGPRDDAERHIADRAPRSTCR